MTTTASSSPALRLGIIVLTVTTAAIHLYLGLSSGLPLFVLNGLGYLTLLAALYGPIPRLLPYRNAVRWLLVGFAALTILLWLVITGGNSTTIGYVDKAVEVLLIILLVAEARVSR
jgi:hypothetical protein